MQLPWDYAPPSGRLLLASQANLVNQASQMIGCAAYAEFAPNTCELRRLFVLEGYRSQGYSRHLLLRLVQEAQPTYQYMILRVIPSMREAWALFESVGFYLIEPYVDHPHEGVSYMALDLRTVRAKT